MIKKQLFLLITLPLITLPLILLLPACQHSMGSKTVSAPHATVSSTSNTGQQTQQTAEHPPPSQQPSKASATLPDNTIDLPCDGELKAENSIEPKRTAPSNLTNQTKQNSNLTTKHKELSPQEEIDNALSLCQSAQNFWETGDLDNALSELDTAYSVIIDLDIETQPEFNQQKDDLRYMISKRILEIYASRNIIVNGNHDVIPITMNSYVKEEIDRLTGPEKKFFLQSLKRAGRYRPHIVAELLKAGLPEELSWLPLIESGFKTNALSPARALGLWQFIPSTGYKFGLMRNYYIDERLDPFKSTQAAISYLMELHQIFGDWATVLAAYNCGEGRVLKTIKEQNINYLDNFWDLYQRLPAETARYVPRFLAVLHIIKNPADYDIAMDTVDPPLEYTPVKITKQIRLKDIGNEIDVSETSLKTLNPELRYALLPPEEYEVRIPPEKADIFLAKLDRIKSYQHPVYRYSYHRVKHGETLSTIARKYHTSVKSICLNNSIHRQNMIVAGKVLKIPASGSTALAGIPAEGEILSGESISYHVKQGDNLWIIARRHETTTKKIMAANGLSSSALHIGQSLQIPSSTPATVKTKTKSVISEKKNTYWVKSGDSPFTIAKKYNMSLNRLLSLNHLTESSKIYPGQKLLVE